MSRSNVKTVLSIASVLVLAPFVLNGAAERPAVVTVLVWTGAGVPERATGTVIAPGKVLTVAHVLAGAERVEVVGRRGGRGEARAASRRAAATCGGRGGTRASRSHARRGRAGATRRCCGATTRSTSPCCACPARPGRAVRFGERRRRATRADRAAARRRGARRAPGHAVQARLRRRINARLVDQPGKPRRPSFELAADIVSGDSGAPVVDSDGEIVGVVYARSTRRGGTAYAVRVLVAPR